MQMADVGRLEDCSTDYKMLLGFCLKSENAKGWKMLLDNTKQRNWWFSSAEQKGEKSPLIQSLIIVCLLR